MANTKISQLPVYSGSAAEVRWFVMNNSGETTTFKFSGYTSQLVPGTGTDSYSTINSTGAAGTNSIAIGKDTNAAGNGSVNIGNSYGTAIGTDSIAIGRHPGLGSSDGTITIGSGAYNNTPNGIAIGHSTSAQQSGICIGSNTTRATGLHSVSLGNAIENNLGTYSIMVGYNNSCYAPYNGNPYGVVIGSGHRVDNTGYYNTILGGANNTLSGNTTGSTLIGLYNYSLPTKNNTAYVNNFNVIGGSFEVGSGNTISSTAKNVGVIGNNNDIDGAAGSAQMYIGNGFSSSAFGNYGLHIGNGHYASGSYNISVGDSSIEQNASYSICVGNSGGSQQHKQWGTDVYNLGVSNQLQGITGGFIFGKNHTISNGGWGGIFAGIGNSISSSGNYNTIIGGQNNSITGTTSGSTILSSNGRTATRNDATFVENLVVFNYAGLNFADDTAAAAGGVVLGQVYHTGGVLKIRIV